jgi:hypothetical protein
MDTKPNVELVCLGVIVFRKTLIISHLTQKIPMKTIFKTLFILIELSISGNAQSIFSTTNGKYNTAILVKINGQNAELKPISCGLMHIARKEKKTGETKIEDKIIVMFFGQI